ncbi:unnamed protein product [Phytomonas sp. EM1]|nr:unnamed protein product [Phytomonas sp. EM1]|eukprot:CCW63252.1 unnamed protein product [Phytomonas sp. isolate EM1]
MSSLLETLQHVLGQGKSILGHRIPPQGSSYENRRAKIWPLSSAVRKEIEKGTVSNMRVVLRGMRRVGKSTLLARLGGHPLPSIYKASMEITATTLRFLGEGYASHEGTRVDVWDVVDSGESSVGVIPFIPDSQRNKDQLELCLKMVPNVCDARNIDVYCGCHLTIFLIDCTRPITLDYAVQEAEHVPYNCCIVFALNFMDVPLEEHKIDLDDVTAACKQLRRTTTSFISQIVQCGPPPLSFSVPALAVPISAKTGAGISSLLECFNAPNELLRIVALEQRLQKWYSEVLTVSMRIAAKCPNACHPSPTATSPFLLSQDEPQGGTSAELKIIKREIIDSSSPPPSSDKITQGVDAEFFFEGVLEDEQTDLDRKNLGHKAEVVSPAIACNHSSISIAESQGEQINTLNVLNQMVPSVECPSHSSFLTVKQPLETTLKVESSSPALSDSSVVKPPASHSVMSAIPRAPLLFLSSDGTNTLTTGSAGVFAKETLLLDAVQDRSAPWDDFFGHQLGNDETIEEESKSSRSLGKSSEPMYTDSGGRSKQRLLVSAPLFSYHLSTTLKTSPSNLTK